MATLLPPTKFDLFKFVTDGFSPSDCGITFSEGVGLLVKNSPLYPWQVMSDGVNVIFEGFEYYIKYCCYCHGFNEFTYTPSDQAKKNLSKDSNSKISKWPVDGDFENNKNYFVVLTVKNQNSYFVFLSNEIDDNPEVFLPVQEVEK